MEDLLECPDYQPSSFLKGKPQSIISLLCFYKYHLRPLCLMHQVIGVDWKLLLHILSLSRRIYLESYVGPGLNICLAGRSRVISCHLRDIGRYLVTVGYNCYRGNNHVLMNKKETGGNCDREATRHGGLGAYLSPSVSVKDRFTVRPYIMLNACLALSQPDKSF